MKPLPIQWKFALWSALATAGAVGLFAVGTLINLYREQLEAIDLEMASEAAVLGRRAAFSSDEKPLAGIDFHPWMAYAVFAPDGRPEFVSPRLDSTAAREVMRGSEPLTHCSALGKWRLRAYAGQRGQTVVVGYDLAEMREIVEDLLLSYALSLPVVLLAAALGGRWVAQRALGPVRALAGAAGTISPERLHVRVPEPQADDELRRLARAFNVMLARLETSFAQTQRFAADASHELRTPLTIMRSEIEQLLRLRPGDAALEQRLLSLQEEASRLDRITEHLLLLARFDAGQVRRELTRIDFSALVREAADDAELLAAAQGVSFTCDIDRGISVEGDALMLRRLVLNLLDNAVRHNERGGRAECRLQCNGADAVLRVRNTGPGIPAAAQASLFQRFFRADPARGPGGHGLGLALCREIARSHGGEVEHAIAEPGWTEFVFRIALAAEK